MERVKVLGYARISRKNTQGVSLAVQAARIEAYCDLYNLSLMGVVQDQCPAVTLDRVGLRQVMERLDSPHDDRVDGVVVSKLDRLSRSVVDFNRLVHDYFGEKKGRNGGRSLFSVGDYVDTRTANGRLMLNLIMSISAWERENIAERIRDVIAYRVAKGETTGQLRFGLKLADDTRGADGRLVNPSLVPDLREQEIASQIRGMRQNGLSFQKIANTLNERGVTTKEGKRWGQTQVIRVNCHI